VSSPLTPVVGGHVFAGTWEQLDRQFDASCHACGKNVKLQGELQGTRAGLCLGWGRAYPDALDRVVRGLLHEAPGDQPAGPSEEAIRMLQEAHLRVLDIVLPLAGEQPDVQGALHAEADAIDALVVALADEMRALRLARDVTRPPTVKELAEIRQLMRLGGPTRTASPERLHALISKLAIEVATLRKLLRDTALALGAKTFGAPGWPREELPKYADGKLLYLALRRERDALQQELALTKAGAHANSEAWAVVETDLRRELDTLRRERG